MTIRLDGQVAIVTGAGTAMTEGLFPDVVYNLLTPESVSPGILSQ